LKPVLFDVLRSNSGYLKKYPKFDLFRFYVLTSVILSDKKSDLLNKWLVIINPNSGKRKGEKDWKLIQSLLVKNEFIFKHVFTEHKFHAINLSVDFIEKGYRKFIVVGGDGTLNEVINGIFLQKKIPTIDIKIGMIPVGTGNDWGRMYQISSDYQEAIKIIKNDNTFIQDAGMVKYAHHDELKSRYFVNMAGMGYDALVAKKTNLMKEKGGGGPFAYLINLFLGLIQYQYTNISLKIDNQDIFTGKIFSMNVGICKYNGGGMMQLPFAVPDNGLLDITVIRKASKFKVIKNIKNLYDGSFVKIPEVETFTGKQIEISSKPANSLFLEADGESLGHSPFEFTIIPKSIKLIRGD
jgi:YegS/Rv2252/BmrU family lipid kinase